MQIDLGRKNKMAWRPESEQQQQKGILQKSKLGAALVCVQYWIMIFYLNVYVLKHIIRWFYIYNIKLEITTNQYARS